MNYDSITGLPFEASFLAYAQYSIEHITSNNLFILVLDFPILKQNRLSKDDRDTLLANVSSKLIRKHSYMKTAYRNEKNDTVVILLDESLISNHDINEELQKAFMCFSSACADIFSNAQIYIHAGIYNIVSKSVSIKTAINNAYSALGTISQNDPTHFVFYRESQIDPQKEALKIIPALEDNWKSNSLLVYLQPKFELKNQTMVGAEALVRIIDTTGHMVKPGLFLPILQKSTMSTEMDLMVIEKILRLLSRWNTVGIPPIPVSVNLSENSLYDPMFKDIFCELMEKYSDIQRYLRIEISENHFLRNPYHINKMIDFFHSFGCMIELDDFGKNLMNYTRDTIPYVDFVKLSSTFWSMSMQNYSHESTFTDYIALLKDCNIAGIAECIENNNELEFIKEHNINYAQGFLFSRPVPFDIFQKKYLTYTFMNA